MSFVKMRKTIEYFEWFESSKKRLVAGPARVHQMSHKGPTSGTTTTERVLVLRLGGSDCDVDSTFVDRVEEFFGTMLRSSQSENLFLLSGRPVDE
jgi:hypothetical protein